MTLQNLLYTAAAPTHGPDNWVTRLMESIGSPGVAIATGLESLTPTIPSELVLLLGGFTARLGELSFMALLFWSTFGSVAGAVVHYWIGALLGRRRTRALFVRLPLVQDSDLDRAERWFERYGGKAVLFGRMIPIVRTYVSLPAGIERMRTSTFLGYTAAGTFVWNLLLLLAGYTVSSNWEIVQRYANWLTAAVGVVLLLTVIRFTAVRLRTRRRAASDDLV